MVDKPNISNLKHVLRLPEFHGVIESDGSVVSPSSEIFTKISLAMNSNHRLKPKYIYTIIKMNRYSVHSELLQERHIEIPLNASVANSSVDSVDNEKVAEFNIDITDIWDKMQPEEVHYRLKSRGQRCEYKLKRHAWTHVLFEAIFCKTRLPCPLAFKSIRMSESGFFATIVGHCSECHCSFFGKIVHAPKEGEKIVMECTITDFDSDVQHNKKRHLKGRARETVAKELVDKNMLACIWRRQKANELMKVGDDEPPHLYSSDVLRRAKLEYNDRELGLPTKDLYSNLQAMKYDMKYEGAIYSIGLDPIYVHYWTKEQLAIYERHPTTLYIDATGSVMKKVLLPNGELCSHVYLYQAVGQVEDKTVPICQMISAVQNTNAISHWLNEFLRVGAMQKASFPIPKEVITDFDKALLGAVSRVFAQKPSLKTYLCSSYELLIGKTNDAPPCLLRLDICHFMNMVARWKCFAGKPARVRQMYLRSMAVLRKQETLADLENVAKAIFTLALSQNKGQDSLADRARSTLTECIRASDGKCSQSVEIPESEENGPEEKPVDDSDLSATNIWEWADKLYKECLLTINNESTYFDDVNGFYCQEFANKFKSLLPYFPLFSEVMRSIYNYGSVNATSAAVESEFNDLKNRIFKNVGLPMRIDKFVARHIASFPGKLKLAMAGRFQQNHLSELTVDRGSVRNSELLANTDNELSPHIEQTFLDRTYNERGETKDMLQNTDSHSNEVVEVPNVAGQAIIDLSNSDNVQSEIVAELKEEQNWRNKNDRPNKKFKYNETSSHDIPNAVEGTATNRTCENVTLKKPIIQNQSNSKNKKNSEFDKKKPKKYFRYTDPCPQFISSDAKYTSLPLMVNAHLCPFIRDGLNTLIVSNTCGYDSLCQIFGMAASISDVYREAITKMQSDIFSCVNTLLTDGVCAKLYRQRASVLKSLLQLKPEVGRNGVIKINADSTLFNLATYLLENDPSCVEHTQCLICGVQRSRKYPVQTTNYNIICDMGISHLAQAIDESRSSPKLCCGKIPNVRITYGPQIVCEVDNGKSDKIALCNFPDCIKPSHAQNYRLAGVIGYEGPRKVQSTGHYVAYVKSDSQWVKYDDTAKTRKSLLVCSDVDVEAHICVYVIV